MEYQGHVNKIRIVIVARSAAYSKCVRVVHYVWQVLKVLVTHAISHMNVAASVASPNPKAPSATNKKIAFTPVTSSMIALASHLLAITHHMLVVYLIDVLRGRFVRVILNIHV